MMGFRLQHGIISRLKVRSPDHALIIFQYFMLLQPIADFILLLLMDSVLACPRGLTLCYFELSGLGPYLVVLRIVAANWWLRFGMFHLQVPVVRLIRCLEDPMGNLRSFLTFLATRGYVLRYLVRIGRQAFLISTLLDILHVVVIEVLLTPG